jgi:hypothetical protein
LGTSSDINQSKFIVNHNVDDSPMSIGGGYDLTYNGPDKFLFYTSMYVLGHGKSIHGVWTSSKRSRLWMMIKILFYKWGM